MQIKQPEIKYNNPISEETFEEVIRLLEIQEEDIIIDIGGGNGYILKKLIKGKNVKGILIDIDQKLIEECKSNSKSQINSEKLKLVSSDAKDYLKALAKNSIDCFLCIGSTYALGGFNSTIEILLPYLKKNGFLLIGEEYWKTKPTEEYLGIIGALISDSRYHYENIEIGEKLGLRYLYSQVASENEWNTFEGKYFLNKEITANQNGVEKKLNDIREFRRAQYKFGRQMMGFGLYLFGKK